MSREYEKNLVLAAARQFGINESIAYQQIDAESSFNPAALSVAGAAGIAQFMPATAVSYGLSNRYDPVASMQAWGAYMTDLLSLFGGDYASALAGYNWGEGRVQTARNKYGNSWLSHAPTDTQNYVARILSRSGSTPIATPIDFFPSNDFLGLPSGDVDATTLALVALGIALLIVVVR